MDRDDTQRQQRIRHLYEVEGHSCAQIGRTLGLSRQRVCQIKDELALTKPGRADQEKRQACIALLMRQGKTRAAIARSLNLSKATVARDIAEHPDRDALTHAQYKARPTVQRRRKIPALILAGKTGPEIAEVLGVSASVIVNDFTALKLSAELKAKVHENARNAISAGVLARNAARAEAGSAV